MAMIDNLLNPNLFDEPVGLLKTGTIKSYDPQSGTIKVKLNIISAMRTSQIVDVPVPHSMFYNNGVFIGTYPQPGTPVVLAQGSGSQWYFISYLADNPGLVPEVELGKILIRSDDNSKITLDKSNNIILGSDDIRIHLNPKDNIFSSNFHEEYHFTQASRHVNGAVKRDLKLNNKISQSLKLEYELYNPYYYKIGMDPSATVNISSSPNKNPGFVENREVVYEFEYASNVSADLTESSLYSKDKNTNAEDFNFINRRDSRADTLSLTLASPNYLMETIKGTVVDIFGNILDLNRLPIPVGKDKNTITSTDTKEKVDSFFNIKELERKSIAYHFEINSRKDLSGKTSASIKDILDIESNNDYARNRSRFFIDVDKEGQFKINVPASSEKGNIPLLTRYENYSTFGTDNPDKLEFRDDNLDIFLDSFASPHINRNSNSQLPLDSSNRGSITLMNGDTIATPTDRLTNQNIKHGTAHHDILNTCYSLSQVGFIDYQNDAADSTYRCIDVDEITNANNTTSGPDLNNIVTNVIPISGDNAMAGGRSGQINLDGSLELNIGANTIDRQSLWLDTAGGIVSNIGRDRKYRSLVSNLDGDVYIQVGGNGVTNTDSRFIGPNQPINTYKGAVFDIRVLNDSYQATMIRIDKNGIQILSPAFIKLHASQGIKMTSDADISIESESLTLQGRLVQKQFGGSI